MELDELKILLKEQPVQIQVVKSADEIAFMLTNKTRSITGKLRRSLRIEILCCYAAVILCAAAAVFGTYSSLRIYFAVFFIFSLLFLPFLYRLLKKINQFSGGNTLPVKENLQSLLILLKTFVKRYFQITMFLVPACLVFSLLLGYNDSSLQGPDLENLLSPNINANTLKAVILIAYLAIFSVAMYYFTRWYLKKLYGDYLHQLQSLIKELEE